MNKKEKREKTITESTHKNWKRIILKEGKDMKDSKQKQQESKKATKGGRRGKREGATNREMQTEERGTVGINDRQTGRTDGLGKREKESHNQWEEFIALMEPRISSNKTRQDREEKRR